MRFTIFIPTYNRAVLLMRALESLEQSRCRDFEVLIVDDGSTDDTGERVQVWLRDTALRVRYHWQPNQGKHVAHNTALALAQGELFLNLDSDDELLPEALEQLSALWEAMPATERVASAGLCGLCVEQDGRLSGDPFPRTLDSDFLRVRCLGLAGEKRCALLTSVLRQYPFPVFDGERHSRPSLILNRLAQQYRTRFVNVVLMRVGHAPDGICANRRRVQRANPQGYRQYFLEWVRDYPRHARISQLLSYYRRYVKYSLLLAVPLRVQLREVRSPLYWLLMLAPAWLGLRRERAALPAAR